MKIRILMVLLLGSSVLFGHCDSLDGPVVQAARQAIVSGDVSLVLAWVKPDHEPAIRQAFLRTMSVRTLGKTAEDLADTWFFETLVRIHRAGEGAPFEGLKPAGTGLGSALRVADNALLTGDLEPLEQTLTAALQRELRERFSLVLHLKGYQPANVNDGRKYVAAYVDFIHFAERLEQSLTHRQETATEHAH